MMFESVETDTVSVWHGDLDTLRDMIAPDTELTCETMRIGTDSGELVIESPVGEREITVRQE